MVLNFQIIKNAVSSRGGRCRPIRESGNRERIKMIFQIKANRETPLFIYTAGRKTNA